MACRLVGAKPLSEPMLECCQLDPKEHISVKFKSKFEIFHSRKCTWKCCWKWLPFCLGLNVLSNFHTTIIKNRTCWTHGSGFIFTGHNHWKSTKNFLNYKWNIFSFWLFLKAWLIHCGLVLTWTSVNIGSGNSLLSDGTKSLPVSSSVESCAIHLYALRPRQDGRHFPDDTFKHIFLNENFRISIKISLKFVPEGPINKIPALVKIMACTDQATSHYLNRWWLGYRRIYASLGLNELRQ